jgi:hypothetical protein
VRSPGRPTRSKAWPALAAWVAIAVLCLSRLIVHCDGPECHGVLELVHAPGQCCGCGAAHDDAADASSAAGAAGGSDEPHETARRSSCVDTAVVIELGPVPQKLVVDGACDPACSLVAWDTPTVADPRLRCLLRFGTGPPRADRVLERLRTTVLLV